MPLFSDLLAEHLQEIRALRRRLEESIQTNDRLREQLERRLAEVERDPGTPSLILNPAAVLIPQGHSLTCIVEQTGGQWQRKYHQDLDQTRWSLLFNVFSVSVDTYCYCRDSY